MQDKEIDDVRKTGKYRTDSIYEGAYFMARECRLLGKEVVGGRKIIFIFEGENLGDLLSEWKGGKPIVNAIKYSTYIQQLKGDIAKFLKEQDGKKEI